MSEILRPSGHALPAFLGQGCTGRLAGSRIALGIEIPSPVGHAQLIWRQTTRWRPCRIAHRLEPALRVRLLVRRDDMASDSSAILTSAGAKQSARRRFSRVAGVLGSGSLHARVDKAAKSVSSNALGGALVQAGAICRLLSRGALSMQHARHNEPNRAHHEYRRRLDAHDRAPLNGSLPELNWSHRPCPRAAAPASAIC